MGTKIFQEHAAPLQITECYNPEDHNMNSSPWQAVPDNVGIGSQFSQVELLSQGINDKVKDVIGNLIVKEIQKGEDVLYLDWGDDFILKSKEYIAVGQL